MSPRKHLIALLLATLVGACTGLEDDLQGEPCAVEDDCWHTQECNQTPEESLQGIPGTCQPEGTGCIPGTQLGCTCNPMDIYANCTALPQSFSQLYPRMVCDPSLLICVLAPPPETTP